MYHCLKEYDQLLRMIADGKHLLKEDVAEAFRDRLTERHTIDRSDCPSSFKLTVMLNGILAAILSENIDYLNWGVSNGVFTLSFDAAQCEILISRDDELKNANITINGENVWDIGCNNADMLLIKQLITAVSKTVYALEHQKELDSVIISGDQLKRVGRAASTK